MPRAFLHLAGSGLGHVDGELDPLPPLPLVLSGPVFCCFRATTFKAPKGLPIHGSAYRRGIMHVPAPDPAVFIEIEKTDLTWAGLWYRAPTCPATHKISGALEGKG